MVPGCEGPETRPSAGFHVSPRWGSPIGLPGHCASKEADGSACPTSRQDHAALTLRPRRSRPRRDGRQAAREREAPAQSILGAAPSWMCVRGERLERHGDLLSRAFRLMPHSLHFSPGGAGPLACQVKEAGGSARPTSRQHHAALTFRPRLSRPRRDGCPAAREREAPAQPILGAAPPWMCVRGERLERHGDLLSRAFRLMPSAPVGQALWPAKSKRQAEAPAPPAGNTMLH